MLLPAVFYIIWDIYFTSINVWSFNPAYITGIKIGNLPIEEVLFFFIVPYCCMFIYECVRCYFPVIKEHTTSVFVFQIIAIALFITGVIFLKRTYTFYTFIFTSLFILLFFAFRRYFSNFNLTAFLITFLICLFPFLVVNGFLTAIPVVIYNNDENLGLRIYTIPFEDIFYGMLLLMMNIAIYEKLKRAPL